MLRMSEEQFAKRVTQGSRPAGNAVAPEGDAGHGNRQKYGNRKTGKYASAKEAKRAGELNLLQAAGQIIELQEQVKFVLIPKQDGERAVTYTADFVYRKRPPAGEWPRVVEDVKSPASRTQQYVIRRKLMLWVHNIRVSEV